jgi:hypothetical protein
MTMLTITKNLFSLVLGIFLFSASAYSATNNCYSGKELNDFKDIYIKLQQQLNYEGTDAYLDKNYKVQVKAHAKDTPYGGKIFEEAMFAEYQNSLRKIGRLYQAAKFENDDSFKSNELLVKFMEAIEDKSSDSSDFIQKTKVKEVIKALEDASIKKFGNTSDKKFVLNSGDKYLLEKLLTHAQDRICNLATFEKTGKDTFFFKADYLQKVKNAPLTRLVNTIKHASISKDSKIDINESPSITGSLIDPNIAIKSAVTENVNQLSEWVKKVKARGDKCLASLKTKEFANSIQANVQSCNLGHFIDTLSEENVSNLESILHFINSNERLLNFAQAKAETAMDELKLESFIDKTFANLGTKITCSIVNGAGGKKKIFVRNLPFNNNKFDSSKVSCKIKGKELKATDCSQKIEFISDDLGRGVEVRQKAKSGPAISLSISENPDCSNISLDNDTPEKPLFDGEKCKLEGEKLTPPKVLIPNEDNTKCVEKNPSNQKDSPLLELKAEDLKKIDFDQCFLQSLPSINGQPAIKMIKNPNGDGCISDPSNDPSNEPSDKAEKDCQAKNAEWIEKENEGRRGIKWEWDGKTCVDKKPAKNEGGKKSESEESEDDAPLPPKQPPGRFVPIQYPTGRPMWISPGAP